MVELTNPTTDRLIAEGKVSHFSEEKTLEIQKNITEKMKAYEEKYAKQAVESLKSASKIILNA